MRRLLAAFGAALLVATACGPTGPSSGGPTAPGAEEKPVAGGRIVEGAISDVKTLQPVISTDTASSGAWSNFYIGLIRSDPDTGDLEGGLADTFELSKDGLTVTYRLRDGLVWSDGQPFTSDDYKYTVEAVARSKKTVRRSTFQDIVGWKDYVDGKADEVKGLQVKDGGKTIEIQLSKVFCPALRNLSGAGGGILPKHHFVKGWDNRTTDTTTNIDDHPLNMTPPASMGPFVFKEHKPGVQVTMTRNEKYYRGAPLIEEWIIKAYADQVAIKAALLTGEVSYGSVQPADVEEVQNAGKEILNFHRQKGVSGYNYIGWNQKAAKAPWLADKRVRQALWYGIDATSIIKNIVLGYGHQVYGHTPQASWAYPDDKDFSKYAYDPNKAKQLLEQAGATMGPDGLYRWRDGKPMQMRIETNQGNKVRETILQIAQEQYKKIGVKIDPLLESFPALLDRTDPGTDYEGFILGWSLGLDPDGYSIWHSSQQGKNQFNNVFFTSPETDKALETGRNGPDCIVEARKKAYATFNKVLNEEAPYTFLYTQDSIVFFTKSLQNIQPKTYSSGSGWNLEKWWIKR
ncbi:MAG: ABC transporter substrate-binding protein [Chloroflexota bacterium]